MRLRIRLVVVQQIATWLVWILSLATVLAGTSPETLDVGRGAWGRLEHLGGQHWLMVVTRFDSRESSHLEFLESTNACRQWKRIGELREPGRKLDNGHLLRLPSGKLLLTGRCLIEGQSYQLPVYASTNNGHSWQRLSNIDASEGTTAQRKKGLWEPFLYLLEDGRVSVIYSNEKHEGFSQILSQKTSSDGGRTWGAEQRIVEEPGGGKLRPGMGVVSRLKDGRYFLVYEVVGLGRGLVHYKISKDGVQWPKGLGMPIENHEAAPYVVTLSDGRLLLTSCSNVLSFSRDNGQTWQQLDNTPWDSKFRYTWPALYETSPGEIVAVRSEGLVKLQWCPLPSR